MTTTPLTVAAGLAPAAFSYFRIKRRKKYTKIYIFTLTRVYTLAKLFLQALCLNLSEVNGYEKEDVAAVRDDVAGGIVVDNGARDVADNADSPLAVKLYQPLPRHAHAELPIPD